MQTKPVSTPVPFSYSKLKSHEQCSFRYYKEKVLRLYPREPDSEAAIYGSEFHEAAEFYIRDGTPMPGKFKQFIPMLDSLNRIKGKKLCELKMGVTENLEKCEFDDEEAYWRGICDLSIVNGKKGYAVDYKTGSLKSLRYVDMGQLELMALGMFIWFPKLEEIKACLLYVVAAKLIEETYTRNDVPRLWAKWLEKFNTMQNSFDNDVWNKNPSGLCRAWCPVLDCPHNGKS